MPMDPTKFETIVIALVAEASKVLVKLLLEESPNYKNDYN